MRLGLRWCRMKLLKLLLTATAALFVVIVRKSTARAGGGGPKMKLTNKLPQPDATLQQDRQICSK